MIKTKVSKFLKSSRLSKYKSSKAIKLSRTKSRFNKTKIFKLKGGGLVKKLAKQYEQDREENTSGNFYNSKHPYNHTTNPNITYVGKSGPDPYLNSGTHYTNPYP